MRFKRWNRCFRNTKLSDSTPSIFRSDSARSIVCRNTNRSLIVAEHGHFRGSQRTFYAEIRKCFSLGCERLISLECMLRCAVIQHNLWYFPGTPMRLPRVFSRRNLLRLSCLLLVALAGATLWLSQPFIDRSAKGSNPVPMQAPETNSATALWKGGNNELFLVGNPLTNLSPSWFLNWHAVLAIATVLPETIGSYVY